MKGIFLDTETNGLNPYTHKILEIALQVVDLKTGEEKKRYETVVRQPREVWDKSDKESLKINGFQWERVEGGKPPSQVSEEILSLFKEETLERKKAVFICQNPSFDRAFFSQLVPTEVQERLQWPYHWLDLASMYWAITLQKVKKGESPPPWQTGFSKDLIAEIYHLPKEAKPHRAMNGVSHLLLCYEAVVGFPDKKHH